MKLLAIETATEACSAAVCHDGRVFERFELAPQRHTELVLPMCEAVLAESGLKLADLDGLAFGRGPGGFTGVRIAVGVIQGIALGTGLKVVAVSSLAALAQAVLREHGASQVITAMDARMGEVYYAAYSARTGVMSAALPEQLARATDVPLPPNGTWTGAGTGFRTYQDALRARLRNLVTDIQADSFPHAQDVLTLALAGYARGEAVEAEYALPVYLRDRVADAKGAQ